MQYEQPVLVHPVSESISSPTAHPRFDELGDLIEHELKFGFDLETAYRRAELTSPGTHAAQTRTTHRLRPDPPTEVDLRRSRWRLPQTDAARKPSKPVGRRDAIANAIRRVNGGV